MDSYKQVAQVARPQIVAERLEALFKKQLTLWRNTYKATNYSGAIGGNCQIHLQGHRSRRSGCYREAWMQNWAMVYLQGHKSFRRD